MPKGVWVSQDIAGWELYVYSLPSAPRHIMEYFFLWIMLSFFIGAYASEKKVLGRFWGGFFLSLIFSPLIGFIAVVVSKPNAKELEKDGLESGVMKKCPDCAELIKAEAFVCRFCGKKFEKVRIQEEQKNIAPVEKLMVHSAEMPPGKFTVVYLSVLIGVSLVIWAVIKLSQ